MNTFLHVDTKVTLNFKLRCEIIKVPASSSFHCDPYDVSCFFGVSSADDDVSELCLFHLKGSD